MKLLDSDQLAAQLSIKKSYLKYLVATKQVPIVKINRLLRFDPVRIQEWLSQKVINPIELSVGKS